MKHWMAGLFLVGATLVVPAYAQSNADDPLATLAQELNLTQAQRQSMREIFFQFLQKQDQVPAPGQVVMENRGLLKDVITTPTFDRAKAQAFAGKVTAVVQEATVNRLQLRHDLYQQLDPQQQQKFLEIVQKAFAGAQ